MRKRAVSLVLCLCMVLSFVPVPALAQNVENDNPFSDVEESDWFYDGVQYVFEHELMKGTNSTIFETLFEPERATQRGMIVTILYRLDGSPPVTDTCPFEDVPRGSNYENAIIWAAINGIVTGYTNTSFGPYDDITRQQMAAILYRYSNVKHYDVTKQANLNVFTDSGRISNYARLPLSWANAEGLINGITPIILAPTEKVTRAQSAVILARFCENIVERSITPPPIATYTVTFDLNYTGAGTNQMVSVEQGKTVSEPDAPKRSGYKFKGWYTASNAQKGTLFDFNTAINADITLYARWISNPISSNHSSDSSGNDTVTTHYYTVTFDTNDGSAISSQNVAAGNIAIRPNNPVRDGYTFEGWYSDSGLNNPYDFTSGVVANITLYAKWAQIDVSLRTFSVTFETNGGSAIDAQAVRGGNTATRPDMPSKDGYFFVDWYSDVELASPFDFDHVQITKDTTVYAGWLDIANQWDNDTDEDELSDAVEAILGTDPTVSDTDGDGLSDFVEVMYSLTDPLEVDTDGDGINDGEEDNDGDGLNNLEEVTSSTNLNRSDTDSDGLTDFDEIRRHLTDPNNADTDGDGVSDGDEVTLGTNPLVFDSTFSITKQADEQDSVVASVETTLTGEQVNTLSVTKFESASLFPDDMPGYIGGAYNFEVDGTIDSATISFEFDSSLLSEQNFEPTIYYFDEDAQELTALNTTIVGNTASTQVTHFSPYILLNRTMFENAFSWIDVWDSHNFSGIEIVFIIDDSGSMKQNDGNNMRLTVASNLIDSLPTNSKIGIVSFANSVQRLTEKLTSDKDEAKGYLSTTYFHSSGGTRLYSAINNCFNLFQYETENTLRVMVVLGDGAADDSEGQVIQNARQRDVKIYTVGLGNSAQYFNDRFRPLAENTGGKFYLTEQAEGLTDIYDDIKEKIDMETDSDDDGIPDYFEDNLTLFNGKKIPLDKNNTDTDGDGLSDGEEVTNFNYSYNEDHSQVIVTAHIESNPSLQDSDGDGLLDNAPQKLTDHDGTTIATIAPKDPKPLVFNGSQSKDLWNAHIMQQRAAFANTRDSVPISREYATNTPDVMEFIEKLRKDGIIPSNDAAYLVQILLLVREKLMMDSVRKNGILYGIETEVFEAEVKIIATMVRTSFRLLERHKVGDMYIKEFTVAAGAFFLNFIPDADGVAYHSQPETWQKKWGFNKFYDWIFDEATLMLTEQVFFNANGKEYVLWLWKGDYWNLDRGAEVGLYEYSGHRSLFTKHYNAISSTLPMQLSLYDRTVHDTIFGGQLWNVFNWYPSDGQWWITGFSPNDPEKQLVFPNPYTMVAVAKIDFSDKEELYNALESEIKKVKYIFQRNRYIFDNSTDEPTLWIMWD